MRLEERRARHKEARKGEHTSIYVHVPVTDSYTVQNLISSRLNVPISWKQKYFTSSGDNGRESENVSVFNYAVCNTDVRKVKVQLHAFLS
jgi:hypothetical protein